MKEKKYVFYIWTTSAHKHTVTEPEQYDRPMTTWVVKSTAMGGHAMTPRTMNPMRGPARMWDPS